VRDQIFHLHGAEDEDRFSASGRGNAFYLSHCASQANGSSGSLIGKITIGVGDVIATSFHRISREKGWGRSG